MNGFSNLANAKVAFDEGYSHKVLFSGGPRCVKRDLQSCVRGKSHYKCPLYRKDTAHALDLSCRTVRAKRSWLCWKKCWAV